MEKSVCVTGGSGFIGSWLVRLLHDRGYTVHATVKDLNDEKETKHLLAMEGAESRLKLLQINLLDYDSISAAVSGSVGVFHLASPCIVDRVHDPESELLGPAIRGTNNVLTAAKVLGVGRVVITSSVSAIVPNPNWPADSVKREDCWTGEECCRNNEISKTKRHQDRVAALEVWEKLEEFMRARIKLELRYGLVTKNQVGLENLPGLLY